MWLLAAGWVAFAALIWFWQSLGWWIVAPLGAYLVALHGSLQHEALHGHPTRSALVNELLVFPAATLWFPYRRYKALHLKHHDNDHLTEPGTDPKSFYLDPQAWEGTPGWLRSLYSINNSMLGRFLLGPAISSRPAGRGGGGADRGGGPPGDQGVAAARARRGRGLAVGQRDLRHAVLAICGVYRLLGQFAVDDALLCRAPGA